MLVGGLEEKLKELSEAADQAQDALNQDKSEKEEFKKAKIEIQKDTCISTILASKGYPEKYTKGHKISGIDSISNKSIRLIN